MIASWLETNPVGRVFLSPLDVVLSDIDIVVPDLIYVSNARAAALLTELHVRGMPELLVEVASPGARKRDDGIKRRLYERIGVTEYWIVDPEVDRIRVYTRDGSDFDRGTELSREHGDVLTTPLMPGLEMPLVRIFPRTVSSPFRNSKVPSSAFRLVPVRGFSVQHSPIKNIEPGIANPERWNPELGTRNSELGTRNCFETFSPIPSPYSESPRRAARESSRNLQG